MERISHGKHLKCLAHAPAYKIGDIETVRRFLIGIVGTLGMRPLADPILYDVPLQLEKLGAEPFEDEGGITGVCILSTSHVSVHSWPMRGLIIADVFSCRGFETGGVERSLVEYFGAYNMKISDLSFSLEENLG